MLRETFITFLFIAAQAADEQMLLQQQVKTSEEFQTTLSAIQESLMQVNDPSVHAAASMVGIAKARADGLDAHGRAKLGEVVAILEGMLTEMESASTDQEGDLNRSAQVWCRAGFVQKEEEFEQEFLTRKTEHEACRAQEAVLWDGNISIPGVVAACDDLAAWTSSAHTNTGPGRCDWPVATDWQQEFNLLAIDRLMWHFVSDLHSWFHEHKTSTFHNTDQCKNARDAKMTMEDTCQTAQHTFENAYCKYYWYVDRVCCVVRGCWNQAHAAFNTKVADIKPNADMRVTKANAIMSVICMLNSLLEEPMGNPNECTFARYESEAQQRINISYPIFPDHETCVLPTPAPNETDALHAEFYGAYGAPCDLTDPAVGDSSCNHFQKYDIQAVTSCPSNAVKDDIDDTGVPDCVNP